MNTEEGGSYQSQAFEEAPLHHEETHPQHDESEHAAFNPNAGISSSRAYEKSPLYSTNDEAIPVQKVGIAEALLPKLNRFAGVGIAKFFFYTGYVLGIIIILAYMLLTIWAGFSRGTAYGIVNIPITLAIGVFAFLFHILFIRLAFELIVSVFVIRERVTAIAAKYE